MTIKAAIDSLLLLSSLHVDAAPQTLSRGRQPHNLLDEKKNNPKGAFYIACHLLIFLERDLNVMKRKRTRSNE